MRLEPPDLAPELLLARRRRGFAPDPLGPPFGCGLVAAAPLGQVGGELSGPPAVPAPHVDWHGKPPISRTSLFPCPRNGRQFKFQFGDGVNSYVRFVNGVDLSLACDRKGTARVVNGLFRMRLLPAFPTWGRGLPVCAGLGTGSFRIVEMARVFSIRIDPVPKLQIQSEGAAGLGPGEGLGGNRAGIGAHDEVEGGARRIVVDGDHDARGRQAALERRVACEEAMRR